MVLPRCFSTFAVVGAGIFIAIVISAYTVIYSVLISVHCFPSRMDLYTLMLSVGCVYIYMSSLNLFLAYRACRKSWFFVFDCKTILHESTFSLPLFSPYFHCPDHLGNTITFTLSLSPSHYHHHLHTITITFTFITITLTLITITFTLSPSPSHYHHHLHIYHHHLHTYHHHLHTITITFTLTPSPVMLSP